MALRSDEQRWRQVSGVEGRRGGGVEGWGGGGPAEDGGACFVNTRARSPEHTATVSTFPSTGQQSGEANKRTGCSLPGGERAEHPLQAARQLRGTFSVTFKDSQTRSDVLRCAQMFRCLRLGSARISVTVCH